MIENQPKMYKEYWALVARMAAEVFQVENSVEQANALWIDLIEAGVGEIMYHASPSQYAEALAGLDYKDLTEEQREKLHKMEGWS